MIDRLPPSVLLAAASQPAGPRAQPTTSFDRWVGPAVRDGSQGADGENDRTHASAEVAVVLPRNDARLAQETGEAVFSFHVRGESGAVEIFSVPWRLGANTALSYLTQAAYTAGNALNARAASESGRPVPAPAVASLSNPAESPRTSASTALPDALVPAAVSLASGSQHSSRPVVELGSATPTAIDEPWLARLLRLLDQQGHDPVLWIRDYRLDDAASRSMVEEVRSLAQRQGFKLERIMVNGRELWHAPHALNSMGKP